MPVWPSSHPAPLLPDGHFSGWEDSIMEFLVPSRTISQHSRKLHTHPCPLLHTHAEWRCLGRLSGPSHGAVLPQESLRAHGIVPSSQKPTRPTRLTTPATSRQQRKAPRESLPSLVQSCGTMLSWKALWAISWRQASSDIPLGSRLHWSETEAIETTANKTAANKMEAGKTEANESKVGTTDANGASERFPS